MDPSEIQATLNNQPVTKLRYLYSAILNKADYKQFNKTELVELLTTLIIDRNLCSTYVEQLNTYTTNTTRDKDVNNGFIDISQSDNKVLPANTMRLLCAYAKQTKLYEFNNINISRLKKAKLSELLSMILIKSCKTIDQLISDYNNQLIPSSDSLYKRLNSISVDNLRSILFNHFQLSNIKSYNKSELIVTLKNLIIKEYGNESSFDEILNNYTKKASHVIMHDEKQSNIEYIIHIADLHISYKRTSEYTQVFNNFITDLKSKLDILKNKTLVVICGDIFHTKVNQRAAAIQLWNNFIKEVCQLFPIIVITGNHDYDMKSSDIDWISASFKYDNFYHLNELGEFKYKNIVFGVSPLMPNDETIIYNMKKADDDHTYIQLYHGTINGSTIDNGPNMKSIYTLNDFGEYDLLLLGDIHKMQYLDKFKQSAYSGSLIQQNIKENIFNHGYILWNTIDKSSEFIEVQNDYCFIAVNINSNNYSFNTEIIGVKKYLTVSFILNHNAPDNNNKLMLDFQSEMATHGIELLSINICKKYMDVINNIHNVRNVTYSKTNVEYLERYLTLQKYDAETIDAILKIHNDIDLDDKSDTINITQWSIDNLEFKNIFCYGNDIINTISFSESGFYKLFAENFSGKTSIINIIKWLFFGSVSGINDSDVLYKNAKCESGFIKCKFSIANSDIKYVLTKNITISKTKVSGLEISPFLQINDSNIFGAKNVDDELASLIGSYQEFELISSISNNDIGILTDNPFKIFKTLFKLDRFDNYTAESKLLLKRKKTELTEAIIVRNEFIGIDKNDLNILQTSLTNNINKQRNFIIHDISILEAERNDLIDYNNTIVLKEESKTMLTDNQCEVLELQDSIQSNFTNTSDVMDEINRLTHLLIETSVSTFSKEEIDKMQSDVLSISTLLLESNNKLVTLKDDVSVSNNLLKAQEYKLNKLYERKSKLSLLVKAVDSIPDEELCKDQLTNQTNEIVNIRKEILINEQSLAVFNTNRDKYNNMIVDIKFTEDEVLAMISTMSSNFTTIKNDIICKLQDKTLQPSDYDDVLMVISEVDYYDILEKLKNNKLCLNHVNDLNIEIAKLTKANNKLAISLNDKLISIDRLKQLLVKHADNKIIIQNNDILTKQIDITDNDINLTKNKISEVKSNTLSEQIKNVETEINKLLIDQQLLNTHILNNDNNIRINEKNNKLATTLESLRLDYNILTKIEKLLDQQLVYKMNISNIQHNKINRPIKEANFKRINELNTQITIKHNENMATQQLLTTLIEESKQLKKDINTLSDMICQFDQLNIVINELKTEYDNLKLYNDILSNNKIPAMILTSNIPDIEEYINDILKIYTNFTIKIVLSDFNTVRKKITIMQCKKDSSPITINSCSGYETIILNIACKLAIKNYCYINTSSIIMIDEVLSKISVCNYDKLPLLFNIIKNNFKHIIVITHIEAIQDLVANDNSITIAKQDKYSYIA